MSAGSISQKEEVNPDCLLLTPGEFITLTRTLPYQIYKEGWEEKFKDTADYLNVHCLNSLFTDELFQHYSYVKIFPNDAIFGVNEHMHQLIKNCPGIFKTASLLRFENVN